MTVFIYLSLERIYGTNSSQRIPEIPAHKTEYPSTCNPKLCPVNLDLLCFSVILKSALKILGYNENDYNTHSFRIITWEDFLDSTVSPILKKARNARTKTAEKSVASYVELHICGRILIISASISTLHQYLSVRPSINGSFFCHFNHEKVTRYQVTVILKSALRFLGYKPVYAWPNW
jgi:hypothetical protein